MFDFSSQGCVGAGFRSRMSERVSRRFEASRAKTAVNQVECDALEQCSLRQSVSVYQSVSVSSVLRQLRCVGTRRVGAGRVESSSRLFAYRSDAPRPHQSKASLKGVAAKLRRAASASVLQRMRDRLVTHQSLPVARSVLRPLGPRSSVPSTLQ